MQRAFESVSNESYRQYSFDDLTSPRKDVFGDHFGASASGPKFCFLKKTNLINYLFRQIYVLTQNLFDLSLYSVLYCNMYFMLRITLNPLNEVGKLLIQSIGLCAAALANPTHLRVRTHWCLRGLNT